MAKIASTQGFSKATIYRDEETGRWMVEEVGKDGSEIFDLEDDILVKWQNVDNVSITIKCENEYNAVKDEA